MEHLWVLNEMYIKYLCCIINKHKIKEKTCVYLSISLSLFKWFCLKTPASWLSNLVGPLVYIRTWGPPQNTIAGRLGNQRERDSRPIETKWIRLNCQKNFDFTTLELNELSWMRQQKALGHPGTPQATCPPCPALAASSVLLRFLSQATEEESKQNKILQLWREEPHLRQLNKDSSRDV